MTHEKPLRSVRIGIFVALALGVLVLTIFAIGQERSLFSRKTRLHTSFADVNGLVVGAPVRLAGVDVGTVAAISFSGDLAHKQARVTIAVEDAYMSRIRRDSRVFLDSKGLLGDKIINITVGTPTEPELAEDAYITPGRSLSFETLASRLEGTATDISGAAKGARSALDNLGSEEVGENIRSISRSLAKVLREVEQGDGLAHHLIYDPKYAERFSDTLSALARTSAGAAAVAGRLDRLLARVESGPGTAHALVYDSEGKEALAALRDTAKNLAELTDKLAHGDGIVRALAEDQGGRELLSNLQAFARRLDHLSAQVEQGRGTLGGLVVDPSVYEDMKSVLGNIERNVLFKALIRYTIKEDGLKRPAKRPAAKQQ